MTRMTSHSHGGRAILLLIPLVLSLLTFFTWPSIKSSFFSGQIMELATISGSNMVQYTTFVDALGNEYHIYPNGTQIKVSTGTRTTTFRSTTDILAALRKAATAISTALTSVKITNTGTESSVTVDTTTSSATYNLVSSSTGATTIETSPRSGLSLDGNLILAVDFIGPDGSIVDTVTSQQALHISINTIDPLFKIGGKAISSIRARLSGSITLSGAYTQYVTAGGLTTKTALAATQGTISLGIRIAGLDRCSAQYLVDPGKTSFTVSESADYKIGGVGNIVIEVLGTANVGLRSVVTTTTSGTTVGTFGWIRIYNIVGPKQTLTVWENDPIGADKLKVPISTNIGQDAYWGFTNMPLANGGWILWAGGSGNPEVDVISKVPGTYNLGWISIPSTAPCTKSSATSVSFTAADVAGPYYQATKAAPTPTISYQSFQITLEISFVSPLADDELYIMTKPYGDSNAAFTTVATIRSGQKGSITVNLQPNGIYDKYVGWKVKHAASSALMDSTQFTYSSPTSYAEVWNSGKKISLTVTASYAASKVQSVQMSSAPVVIQDSAKFAVKVYGPNQTPASGLLVRAYTYDMNLRDRPWNGSFTTDSMGEVLIDPGFRVINRNSTQVKFFVYDPNGTTVIGQGIASLWALSPVYIVSIPLQTPPPDPPAPASAKCTIFGRVTDENGLGLSGAYVTIIEDGFMQQTDGQGYYRLSDRPVPPGGSYRVQATASGWYSPQVKGVTVAAGQSYEVNFQLAGGLESPPVSPPPPHNDPSQSPTSGSVSQAQPSTTTNTISSDQPNAFECAIASLFTLLSSAAVVIKVGGATL